MQVPNFMNFARPLTSFNDISAKNSKPVAKSSILQFYSANRNIGNYTPVLGIQDMLGQKLDTWNIHRKPIDWNFVYQNYKSVIVGGAGLLHRVFENFWNDLDQNCRLPIVIWGIGVCLPEHEGIGGVSKKVVQSVFKRAILSNVRDELTCDFYELENSVDVSFCPTIHYIATHFKVSTKSNVVRQVLHSHHIDLEPSNLTPQIKSIIEDKGWQYKFTKNVESKKEKLRSILLDYKRCDAVVTTRLHGAIIAYSFKRPYIALSFDPKIDAFVQSYGGGALVKSVAELQERIPVLTTDLSSGYAHELAKVRNFGARASTYLLSS